MPFYYFIDSFILPNLFYFIVELQTDYMQQFWQHNGKSNLFPFFLNLSIHRSLFHYHYCECMNVALMKLILHDVYTKDFRKEAVSLSH